MSKTVLTWTLSAILYYALVVAGMYWYLNVTSQSGQAIEPISLKPQVIMVPIKESNQQQVTLILQKQ
ncbi:hypothetical protein [Brevibacillus dissolubilis]|uniref:hypothetical protein n=1 Tax=Brevibacillus dissolubilis TaxID=1844116 RepID=UPI0011169580|nr:hypothetical protein [Brevibacillus dissolubilis]